MTVGGGCQDTTGGDAEDIRVTAVKHPKCLGVDDMALAFNAAKRFSEEAEVDRSTRAWGASTRGVLFRESVATRTGTLASRARTPSNGGGDIDLGGDELPLRMWRQRIRGTTVIEGGGDGTVNATGGDDVPL